MQFSDKDLHNAHRCCWGNEEQLTQSDKAGCFNCLHVFEFFGIDLIKEWSNNSVSEDLKKISEKLTPYLGKSLQLPPIKRHAVCPQCRGDTLIGSASGYPVSNPNFLKAMHDRWMRRSTGSKEDREERVRLIQEAKTANQAFVILPPQNADAFPKDLNIDPKPQTLLCLQCKMETYDPANVDARYCGNCDMVMTNVITSAVIKESYDQLKPMEAEYTLNTQDKVIIDHPQTLDEVMKSTEGFKKGEVFVITAGTKISPKFLMGWGIVANPASKFYDYTDLEAKPSTEDRTLTGKGAEEANLYWKHVGERQRNETEERERQKKADRLGRLTGAGLSEKHAALFESSFEDMDTVVKVINMMFEHGYGCETIG